MKKQLVLVVLASFTGSNYGMMRSKRSDKPHHKFASNKLNLLALKETKRFLCKSIKRTQERVLLEEKAAPHLWNICASMSLKKVLKSEERKGKSAIFYKPQWYPSGAVSWLGKRDCGGFCNRFTRGPYGAIEDYRFVEPSEEIDPALLNTLKNIIKYNKEEADQIKLFAALSEDNTYALVGQHGIVKPKHEPPYERAMSRYDVVDIANKSTLYTPWLSSEGRAEIERAHFCISNSFIFVLRGCALEFASLQQKRSFRIKLDNVGGAIKDMAISSDGQHILVISYDGEHEKVIWYHIDHIVNPLDDAQLAYIASLCPKEWGDKVVILKEKDWKAWNSLPQFFKERIAEPELYNVIVY